jgi:hypothetical protein
MTEVSNGVKALSGISTSCLSVSVLCVYMVTTQRQQRRRQDKTRLEQSTHHDDDEEA